MKTFKKVLASALAAAMVVTAFPVTNAEAATKAKLSTKKATIYVGQSKTIKVTLPKGAKITSVKTSKKAVATVKKSGKKVVVKAVKAGKATVTVKVTPKKGKATNLKATITVKNPTLTVKAAATELAVGETTTVKATATPKKTVSFKSSDETIATVDATGAVKAVKAGTVKITATAGKLSKDVDLTIKNVIFKSVKQTKANTLVATFAGDTKNIKASDIKITNTANNAVFAVKEVAVNEKDATQVSITTFAGMKDGKDYTVEYDGTTQNFTATDGVVVSLGLEKTQIDAATETEIKMQSLDAQGIVIDEVTNESSKITMVADVANGYMNGTKLFLGKAGDTAKFDLTYHKGTYDANGKEDVIEAKGLVITAVEPAAVTVTGWATKIGASGSTFANVKETKVAVADTKTVYIQYTNSKKEKITDLSKDGYTVESSNTDALILSNYNAAAGTVEITAAKEGTSYILVKDAKGNVVTTLPITIGAARKATTLELSTAAVTVSTASALATVPENVKVTVKDQYGDKVALTSGNVTFKTLTYNNGVTTVNTDTTYDSISNVADADNVVTVPVTAGSNATGTYVVKVTAKNLSKTLTISVKAPKVGTTTSYAFEMSATTVDTVVTPSTTTSTVINAKAYMLNGGVKTDVVTCGAYDYALINAKNEDVTATYVTTDAAGKFDITAYNQSNGKKMPAGTYTLKITAKTGANMANFTRTIVVKDSQPVVTAKRVKTSGASMDACFEYYYEGAKITPTAKDYYEVGSSTTTTHGSTAGTYALDHVDVTFNVGSNPVVQSVKLGVTVTVAP